MDLTPFVEHLRRELGVAAAAGGEEARALAERLTGPLESSVRLALLRALSAAADEITRELAPGSVEVRLRGLEPDFVVSLPSDAPRPDDATMTSPEHDAPLITPPPPDADDGGTSRITLRVPESLKPRIDEAAARDGLSVNAWLVRAVNAALEPGDRSGRPPGAGPPGSGPPGRTPRPPMHGQRYTGWVR